ncbi:MAG: redoxin domain-containing protein [Deltaproteobacteria bacterium]|nr:MAG: redoxin domain-containing protein [Deltaproteobacteria bacterium]
MGRNKCILASLLFLLCFVHPALLLGLDLGEKAPDFELLSTKGDKLRLSSYSGKKNVVLQFYVLDFTPT